MIPVPVPVLFLIGDTGGGHRSAAEAVSEALSAAWPGRFRPVLVDPLRGPAAPRRLRWLIGLYGPAIRITPWLWGWLWHGWASPQAIDWARRSVLAPAYRGVADAVGAGVPALIVAFHPMAVGAAVRARDRGAPGVPVVTVITDLVTAHLSWRDAAVDHVVVPSAAIARCCAQGGIPRGRCSQIGLPVAAEFAAAPPSPAGRRALRRRLGLPRDRFLVVLTGGAEGSGGLYRRAAALLEHSGDVQVAVICGRNRILARRLARRARREGGRLTVCGFVGNMADWMRCADVVVGQAGPGTIAEAACCAAPLILTSCLPGQEEGNAEFVVSAGAGSYAPRLRDLVAEVARLRADPGALAAMRAAAAGLSRPGAAAEIAGLLAGLARHPAVAAAAGRGRPDDPDDNPEVAAAAFSV